ncbi:MAG: flagellar basal body-associated FliL family protein [Woeseiaceae bacterium]
MAEEENATENAEKSGGMMKKLMFAGIGLALVGAGVVGGMTFFGGDAPAEGEELVEEAAEASDPALYTSLHPPLVVNFKDSVGDSHFMQITMEVMARDQNVINSVREHTPVIRNSLILLYSGVIYDEITTRGGKEQMLADGLAEIQKVMTEQIGEPGVEAVYFTALVIQ